METVDTKQIDEVVENTKDKDIVNKSVKKDKNQKAVKKVNPNSFWTKMKNFFSKLWNKIAGFFVRTYQDLTRTKYSSKKNTWKSTLIVLSYIFLFGLCIILYDVIIAQIFKLIY